jgi:uncharacterized protein (DUF58 family)
MPASASPGSPLLGPDFVRELEALGRRLDVRARSGGEGSVTARRRGGASEFDQHRAYDPGDDVRRLDWAAYARSGEPVVKLFRADEDVVVRLLCDASASLGEGAPPKLDAVRRLAAAVGYMALARSERAQILVAGAGLARDAAPLRGRNGVPALLRGLSAIEARGGTDLARAIDAVVLRSPRPGLLVVLSDFLDPGPVTRALARAAAAKHDVVIAHVVAPEEIDPRRFADGALEGDLALEDAETGAVVEVTLDAAALEAYARRFAALCDGLRAFARARGAAYVRVRTDEPLEGAVRRIVARGID